MKPGFWGVSIFRTMWGLLRKPPIGYVMGVSIVHDVGDFRN